MLFGPKQADGSQAVHRHLAHPPEDMLAAHPYPAPELVGRPLLLAERMPPAALEQDEILAVLRDQVRVAGLREVGAAAKTASSSSSINSPNTWLSCTLAAVVV